MSDFDPLTSRLPPMRPQRTNWARGTLPINDSARCDIEIDCDPHTSFAPNSWSGFLSVTIVTDREDPSLVNLGSMEAVG